MMHVGFCHGINTSCCMNQQTKWGLGEEGLYIKYVKEYRFFIGIRKNKEEEF